MSRLEVVGLRCDDKESINACVATRMTVGELSPEPDPSQSIRDRESFGMD